MRKQHFFLLLTALMMAGLAMSCHLRADLDVDDDEARGPQRPEPSVAMPTLRNAVVQQPVAIEAPAPAIPVPAVAPLAVAPAEEPPFLKKDVPYVPTGEEVVEAMLRLAKAGKDDTVYDLGCGDGRIVVMAAKKFEARGVGVDIDPERIKESNENAAAGGVQGRVRFVKQDLFQAEIKDATVVTLYLLPSVNLRLRPKLLAELRPGTRIVSHSFDMGDWQPDKTAIVEGVQALLWIVPANASGTWRWTMPGAGQDEPWALELDQKFQRVEGTLVMGRERMPIREAMLEGDRLRFMVARPGDERSGMMRFEGRLGGESIRGTIDGAPGVQGGSGRQDWAAQRDSGTVKPVEGEAGQLAGGGPKVIGVSVK